MEFMRGMLMVDVVLFPILALLVTFLLGYIGDLKLKEVIPSILGVLALTSIVEAVAFMTTGLNEWAYNVLAVMNNIHPMGTNGFQAIYMFHVALIFFIMAEVMSE